MTPRELILEARNAVKKEDWNTVDKSYQKAIQILEKRKNHSMETKEAFFSAKAEFFCIKPYLPERESFEDFRNRVLDAIRFLNECYKLGGKESDTCFPDIYSLMNQFIKLYGCYFGETYYHIMMGCPIQLNDDDFGSTGLSIGAFYDKAICSICKLDILDEKCHHVINDTYDGKKCIAEFSNYQIAHVSFLDRPKNNKSRVSEIYYPKEFFLEKQKLDISQFRLEDKLDVRCTRCLEENIDPIIITPEMFFEMQGLSISFDKEPKIIRATKDMKEGQLYFGSTMHFGY